MQIVPLIANEGKAISNMAMIRAMVHIKVPLPCMLKAYIQIIENENTNIFF